MNKIPNRKMLSASEKDILHEEENIVVNNENEITEKERKRCEFFRFLTEEAWFKYVFDSHTLSLPYRISAKIGVPQTVIEPCKNKRIMSYFEGESGDKIKQAIESLSTKNACCDETLLLNTPEGKKWFRFSAQAEWNKKTGKPEVIFGRISDIDENMKHIGKIENIKSYGKNANIPVSILKNDVPSLTAEQVNALMRYFKKMFTVVRLVDPKICMQFAIDSMGEIIEKPYHCYSVWNKSERCENCISSTVAHTRQTLTKIEFIDNQVYNVSASYLLVDGKPYVLELASYVDHDSMMSAGEKYEMLKTISAHNRQLYIDPVTGVYNRRYFDDKLRDLSGQFAFAMLDVDNFKQINDTYGHLAGDAALAAVAQKIKGSVRSCDDVIRYGGDEFFLFLRDMPRNIIERKLDEILHSVQSIRLDDYPDLRMTISIGGAYEKGKMSQILRKADMAMYAAKNTRNSVAMYDEAHENK